MNSDRKPLGTRSPHECPGPESVLWAKNEARKTFSGKEERNGRKWGRITRKKGKNLR